MGRLGTRASVGEILEAIGAAKHVRLEGLMTHLASSANYATTQTEEQLRVFRTPARNWRGPASIRQSCIWRAALQSRMDARMHGSAWCGRGTRFTDMFRQVAKGTAPPRLLEVRPALAWKTAVLAVKDLPAGALVGYGGMYRTTQPTRIAVLAAGYADGIPHRLSNKGRVIANGHLAPIIGAVSMDLTTIDITHCPPLATGDAVTLLGSEGGVSIDAQQIARIAGTISYSVLCGIHARVKRIYIDSEGKA